MKGRDLFSGIFFIAIGALLLCSKFFSLDFLRIDKLWPLFVLIPGLLFEIQYFVSKRNAGLLVPGGILTTIGFLFLFETYTNWHYSAYTWPVYIFAVAIGLFQLYLFGGRAKGLLVPVFILSLVASVSALSILGEISRNFWLFRIDSSYVISIIFILLGLYVLLKNIKTKN